MAGGSDDEAPRPAVHERFVAAPDGEVAHAGRHGLAERGLCHASVELGKRATRSVYDAAAPDQSLLHRALAR